MQFRDVNIAQQPLGGPQDPPSYVKDPNRRRSGMEFIRTVKIMDNSFGAAGPTGGASLTRIDVDIPEANFLRYNEILFSFNGGFNTSAAASLFYSPKKHGVNPGATVYSQYYGFASTTSQTYTTENSSLLTIATSTMLTGGGAIICRKAEIYVNQYGYRSMVIASPYTTTQTAPAQMFAHGTFPVGTAVVGNDSTIQAPYYHERDYPGLSLSLSTGNFRPTALTSGNGLECNIYGFIR